MIASRERGPLGQTGPTLTVGRSDCVAVFRSEAGEGEVAFEGEFFAAELDFLFLNGGVAFADAGVAGFVDDGGEFLKCLEVGGVVVALVDGSEVEGLLFEEFEGVGGKAGVAGGSVMADFGGGFFGVAKVGSKGEGHAAFGVAGNGHMRDFALPFGEAIFGDLTVRDLFIEPRVDVLELAVGEADESAQAAGVPDRLRSRLNAEYERTQSSRGSFHLDFRFS